MQKFREDLSRWERQFRRYGERYEEEGLERQRDRRLSKPPPKRVPTADAQLMLEPYCGPYRDMT